MREYMDKRAAGGSDLSRRVSNLASRDRNHKDRSIQCCNRIGCSTKYYINGSQLSNPEKHKYPMASFGSMRKKSESGSSTKSPSNDCRKTHQERWNRTLLRETSNAESSNRQGRREDLETSDGQGEIVLPDTKDKSAILHGLSGNVSEALVNYGTKSKSRIRTSKQANQLWESGNQDTSSSSSIRHSIASRNTSQINKHASQVSASRAQRYGLRNDSCPSLSNTLPSGSSSSDSGCNRRVDMVRRPSDGKTSSSRSKGISSSNGGYSGSRRRGLMSQQASRRAINQPIGRDGTVSARMLRAPTGKTSLALSEQEDGRPLSQSVPIITSEVPQEQVSISEAVPESTSGSFSIEFSSNCNDTTGQTGSNNWTTLIRPISHSEDTDTDTSSDPLGDRDGYRHFNMEGITEVLLALERIEQNEELTYEQLIVLEANLSLRGLVFHDQHRDMRLDIDNMSYEELLALEEKMGTVSTALTEEALSRCLRRSIYAPLPLLPGITGFVDDDIKCSICQEEYVVGDEVGRLACEHWYHVVCIHQWLGRKSWCPICKASACSS